MDKKKIKIAFFHCSFVYSGGGERIALEGTLGLRRKGYIVDLYSPAINWENCFPDLLKKVKPKPIINGLPRWFPLRDAIDMGLSSLAAPLLVNRFKKYDAFVGENQPGVWLAYVFARLLGKPYIIYLNQPNRMLYPRSIDIKTGWKTNANFVVLDNLIKVFKPLVAFLDKKSIINANFICINGHYIGDVISQIYGINYLDCPAGCDPFPHGKLNINSRKYYKGKIKVGGKTIEKPYILLTNRHYPQKRFDYAIRAMPKVLKSHKNVRLVITGAFTSTTYKWQKLAKKLEVDKNIVWLNEVSNEFMGTLYDNAALYVYTSPNEDFGMGVVEAEEYGIPVVAWNYGGPTVTIVDGKTGFLAEPYKVQDFANKMIFLLRNPKKRVEMGKNASKHAKINFSWANHVNILDKALQDSLVHKKE